MATGEARSDRPAEWNIVSAGVPLLGFIVGSLVRVILLDSGTLRSEAANEGLRVWCAFCAAGVAIAIVAFVRAERFWGVTALGFLLNFSVGVLIGVWLLNMNA